MYKQADGAFPSRQDNTTGPENIVPHNKVAHWPAIDIGVKLPLNTLPLPGLNQHYLAAFSTETF